jgi:uroporphyrin-III C-methyltransferase/precorrin-2 dehydrogenase/sirohydrochlorin ferrochelatase
MMFPAPDQIPPGRVTLIGAGPGDPELLTVRALRRLAQADIVFIDRLVGDDIAAMIPKGARRVYVGKSKGEHSVPQRDIEARLIAAARAGLETVRLKGGDPFIFGRGGEEVEALRAAGLTVEVIPGVSSALAAAASAQIPLTHRRLARSVTFVTGHAAIGGEPDLDWQALARPGQSVVIFMGLGHADLIARRLVAAGARPDLPAAIVQNASRPDERSLFVALSELGDRIADAGMAGPALIIIGEAAGLAPPRRALEGQAEAPSLASLWEMLA